MKGIKKETINKYRWITIDEGVFEDRDAIEIDLPAISIYLHANGSIHIMAHKTLNKDHGIIKRTYPYNDGNKIELTLFPKKE